VSKESRRAARAARESRRLAGGAPGPSGNRAASGAAPAGPVETPGVVRGPAHRPPSSGPAGTPRAGRRDRARSLDRRSFLERYRTPIIAVAALAIAAVAIGVVFLGATQKAYACSTIFNPSPTPTISPGSSDRLGFPQDDMGNSHVVATPQRYTWCPPASGNHFNATGLGPIRPRVYGPNDNVGPSNWVHNLEHGGLVVLYRSDSPGATADGQSAFREFFNSFPASPTCKIPAGQVGPVIAKFDDMPYPFAALVWDRVMPLGSWDPNLALRFFNTEAERLDADGALVSPPEKLCNPRASASPGAAPSGSSVPAAPSGSPAPSASAGATASAGTSPASS